MSPVVSTLLRGSSSPGVLGNEGRDLLSVFRIETGVFWVGLVTVGLVMIGLVTTGGGGALVVGGGGALGTTDLGGATSLTATRFMYSVP